MTHPITNYIQENSLPLNVIKEGEVSGIFYVLIDNEEYSSVSFYPRTRRRFQQVLDFFEMQDEQDSEGLFLISQYKFPTQDQCNRYINEQIQKILLMEQQWDFEESMNS